jgi:hypothetical protein
MLVIDRGGGRTLASLAGDSPQILQQHLAGRVPEMQSDVETRLRGSGEGHPKLIRPIRPELLLWSSEVQVRCFS